MSTAAATPLPQAHNGYHAISDGRVGGNPLVFVEAVNPGNRTIWYVPGTHADDPLFEQAPAMAHYARAHRTHYWLGQYPQQQTATRQMKPYVSSAAEQFAPGNFVTTWNPDLGRNAVGVTRAIADVQEANPLILVKWMHDLSEEWVRSEYLYLAT